MQYSSIEIKNSDYFVSAYSGSATVKPNAFGNIYTAFSFYNYEQFKADSEPYKFNYLRWPGGSMAEEKHNYSLTNENLLINASPGSGRTFREVLEVSIESGYSMSMVIPTRQYMNVSGSITEKATLMRQGQADLYQFLMKLYSGHFGEVPKDFTLEIGNESSWIGWRDGDYGKLANAFLTTFRRAERDAEAAGYDSNIKIAIQMATTENQAVVFRHISAENLREVDGFVRHSGLSSSVDGSVTVSGEVIAGYNLKRELSKLAGAAAYFESAFAQMGIKAPEFNVLDTAWTVGPAGTRLTSDELQKFDVGSIQGTSAIKLFSQLIAAGSDSAAVWGAVGPNPNRFFWNDAEPITHGGEALRLMSESLVGMTLLSGKVSTGGEWIASGGNFDTVAYEDNQKIVVFLTSGTIPGVGLTVNVAFDGLQHLGIASVEVVGTVNPNSPRSEQRPSKPVTNVLILKSDGSFEHQFNQSNEIVRVIIYKSQPSLNIVTPIGIDSRDMLFGTQNNDVLDGTAGRNYIFGREGFDHVDWSRASTNISVDLETKMTQVSSRTVVVTGVEGVIGSIFNDVIRGDDLANRFIGNSGDDTIFGRDGSDTIGGGSGNDHVDGGAGNDYLDGGFGNDEIFGGDGNDTIIASTGIDTVDGGSGADVFIYNGATSVQFSFAKVVTSASTFKAAELKGAVLTYLRNVEGIRLGSGDDSATGNGLGNFIDGGSGNDTISGWGGADTIKGGNGDDRLFGNRGDDILDGGAGNDFLNGGEGSDLFVYSGGRDTFDDVKQTDGDSIDFSFVRNKYGIDSVDDLTQMISQDRGKSRITFSESDVLTLNNITPDDILSGYLDIIF